MATIYTDFDTTHGTLIADLKTAILTSTDWSNITGNVMKATTTRGAEMVVDLTDAALSLQHMIIAFYRSHNGVTGVDKITRYLYFKQLTTGTVAASPLHVTVSAGKEHLYVAVEGPRSGETGASGTYGSMRQYFFISDLVPYFGTDTVPAVVTGAASIASSTSSIANGSATVWVSRNQSDTASWVGARMGTVRFPTVLSTDDVSLNTRSQADGNVYLFPYVVFEESRGIRGRLSSFFHAGANVANAGEQTAPVGVNVTFDGNSYRTLAPAKADNSGAGSPPVWGPFGAAANGVNNGVHTRGVVVAVPVS